MSFVQMLAQTPVALWVQGSAYGYYICLAGHAIGMGVVAGIMFMLGIRVLGFGKDEPLLVFDRLFPVAWAGFALNAVTGVMLFSSNGERLIENVAFLLKLSMIAAGGVAVFVLWRVIKQEPGLVAGTAEASTRAKVLAVATLALWVGAIVAGRIIGYTIKYA